MLCNNTTIEDPTFIDQGMEEKFHFTNNDNKFLEEKEICIRLAEENAEVEMEGDETKQSEEIRSYNFYFIFYKCMTLLWNYYDISFIVN